MKICLNKICIFFILFFIASCGVKKNVVKELESININDIVSQINSNKINSNWLYVKGKMKMISNNDKITLGVSMKIRQDSLIWLSISAPINDHLSASHIKPSRHGCGLAIVLAQQHSHHFGHFGAELGQHFRGAVAGSVVDQDQLKRLVAWTQ